MEYVQLMVKYVLRKAYGICPVDGQVRTQEGICPVGRPDVSMNENENENRINCYTIYQVN
jgi:hypothetical protein